MNDAEPADSSIAALVRMVTAQEAARARSAALIEVLDLLGTVSDKFAGTKTGTVLDGLRIDVLMMIRRGK